MGVPESAAFIYPPPLGDDKHRNVIRHEGAGDRLPSSGTGAWEAAIVNTLEPGDEVLMFETGHFATLWKKMAERFGLSVDFVPGDWRRGVDPTSSKGSCARIAWAR